jgi:hypothetical protein
MVLVCNPSFLGGWDQEDCCLRPTCENSLWDPHPQNHQSKMDWWCGSCSKVTGLQALSPEFKPHSHQEKKKRRTKERQWEYWLNVFTFLVRWWIMYSTLHKNKCVPWLCLVLCYILSIQMVPNSWRFNLRNVDLTNLQM